jgi:hypothetical protein
MENSILKQFYNIFNDFELFNQVVNDHNYNNLDYRNVISILKIITLHTYIINDQDLSYSETMEYMIKNQMEQSFVDGLILLEKFRVNQITQIETLLNEDYLIQEIIKNQLKNILKDRHFTMLVPNFFDKFSITKDKESLVNSFIELSVKQVINNCKTFNYLQLFISNGLNLTEYQSIDSHFQYS